MMNFFLIITANWSWSLYTNILIVLLSVQNISFILTVIMNQGMLSRDPSIHSIEYLKTIAEKDQNKMCMKCKIIYPEGSRNNYHCRTCDVCVKNYDHHCPWCSKCIAGGNLYYFYVFIFTTSLCLMCLWFNVIFYFG